MTLYKEGAPASGAPRCHTMLAVSSAACKGYRVWTAKYDKYDMRLGGVIWV